jgi:hypothetical protein
MDERVGKLLEENPKERPFATLERFSKWMSHCEEEGFRLQASAINA